MELHSSLSFEHDGTMFELHQRTFYEDGPAKNAIDDFASSFDAEIALEATGDGDYSLYIPFQWAMSDEFELYLDLVFGNGDGALNETEASIAGDQLNSSSYEWSGLYEEPPFYLNGQAPSSSAGSGTARSSTG